MGNINTNRLQFVHCDTLFATREEAMAYVNGDFISIKRPALYAEPMVLKYGEDASNPNILLAIGSIGDGVNQSNSNKVFFIDFARLDESMKQVIEDAETLKEDVANVKTIISNVVVAAGLSEDGTYVANSEDEILKAATSLFNADGLLSQHLLAEIERAKTEEARIEAKNTLYVNESSSVAHTIEREDSGVTLTSSVKLAEQHIYGENVLKNNIILDTENGLWASVEVSEGENTIEFKINGVVTEIPNVHLESGEYSKEKESLIFKLSDGKNIEVPVEELIEEWAVPTEGEQKSPVVLKRSHKEYEDLEHDEAYQDILHAELRILESDSNTLKVDNAYNLYVQKSTLKYDNARNILTFNNGLTEESITLNSGSILDNVHYDSSTNELVLRFKLENNDYKEVRISVAQLALKINPVNNGNVTIHAEYNSITNTTDLSADVNISNIEDNILKTDGNSLYVKGTAENIRFGQSNVSSELHSLMSNHNELNKKVDEEFIKLNNKDSELTKVVEENKISIANEISRAQAKEDELTELANSNKLSLTELTEKVNNIDESYKAKDAELISSINENKTSIETEISRAQAKEDELSNSINDNKNSIVELTERVSGIDEAYKKEDAEIRTHIDDLEADIQENKDEIIKYVDDSIANITYHVDSTNTLELNATDNVIKGNVKLDTTQSNIILSNENGLYANVDIVFDESTHKLTYTINDKVQTIDITPFTFVENAYGDENGNLVLEVVLVDGTKQLVTLNIHDDIYQAIEELSENISSNLAKINQLEKDVHDNDLRLDGVESNLLNLSTSHIELSSKVSDNEKRIIVNEGNISTLAEKVSVNETKIATLEASDSAIIERVATSETEIENAKASIAANTSEVANVRTMTEANTSNISSLQTAVNKNSDDIATSKASLETVTNEMASVKESVATNTTDVNAVKETVNKLSSDVDAVEVTVANNSNEVAAMKEAVTTNTSNIATINTSLDGIKSDITSVKESVATNTTDVNAVKETVNKLSSDVDAVEVTVANNSNDIASLKTSVEKNIVDIAESKSSIEREISRAQAKESELSNSINANTSSIVELTERVSGVDEAYKKEDAEIRTHITSLESDIQENKEELKKYVDDSVSNITYHVDSTNTLELNATDNVIKGNVKLDTTQSNIILSNENGLYANVDINFNESTHELTYTINEKTSVVDLTPFTFVENAYANENGDLVIEVVLADGSKQTVVIDINDDIYQAIETLSENISSNLAKINQLEKDVHDNEIRIDTIETNLSNLSNSNSELSSKVSDNEKRIITNEGNISTLTNKVSANETKIASLEASDSVIIERVATSETEIANAKASIVANTSEIANIRAMSEANTSNVSSLQATVGKNSTDIETSKASIENINKEIASVKESIATNTTDINATKETVNKLSSDVDAVEVTVANNSNEVAAMKEAVNTNTSNIATINTSLDSVKSDVTSVKESVATNTSDVNAVKETVNKLSSDVDAVEVTVANNSNEVAAMKEAVTTNTSNIATINTSLETVKSDVTSVKESVAANTADIASINASVANNTAEVASVKVRLSNNESRISSVETSSANNTKSIDTLRASVEKNSSDITNISSLVSKNEATISGVNELVSKNTSDINAVKASLETATTKISDVETLVGINKSEIASVKESVNVNASDIDTVEASVSNLTNKVSSVENSVVANTTEIANVKSLSEGNASEIANIKTNTSALSERVSVAETELASVKTVSESNSTSINDLVTSVSTNTNDIATLKSSVEAAKITVKDSNSVDLTLSQTNELEANVRLNLSDSTSNILKLDSNGLSANVVLTYDAITGTLYFDNGRDKATYKIVAQSLVYDVDYNAAGELVLKIRTADGTEEEVVVKIDKLEGGSENNSPIIINVNESQPGVKKVTATLNVSTDSNNLITSNNGSLYASKVASDHIGTYRDKEMTMQEALGRIAEEINDCDYDSDIENLNTKLDSVEASNANLNARVDIVETQISDVKEDVSDVKNDIEEIKSINSDSQNKVNDLTDEINEIKSIIGTYDNEETISYRLNELEKGLTWGSF